MLFAAPNDYIGIAALVTSICTGIAAVIAAVKSNRAATGVDGLNTELKRQNVELKKAVADPSTVMEQVAGEHGNVSVGTDKGVVTVENKPRDVSTRERKGDR